MVNLILFFAVSLVISSLFCIGLWIASRGSHTTNILGVKEYKDDQLFYFITEYLTEEIVTEKQLHHSEYVKIEKMVKEIEPFIESSIESPLRDASIIKCKSFEDFFLYRNALLKILNVDDFLIDSDGDTLTIKIVSKSKKFKFNKYIRKPIIGCYKCFSSFWGIPMFIINYNIYVSLGGNQLSIFTLIYLAIIHTFALTTFNTILEKKTK